MIRTVFWRVVLEKTHKIILINNPTPILCVQAWGLLSPKRSRVQFQCEFRV